MDYRLTIVERDTLIVLQTGEKRMNYAEAHKNAAALSDSLDIGRFNLFVLVRSEEEIKSLVIGQKIN